MARASCYFLLFSLTKSTNLAAFKRAGCLKRSFRQGMYQETSISTEIPNISTATLRPLEETIEIRLTCTYDFTT